MDSERDRRKWKAKEAAEKAQAEAAVAKAVTKALSKDEGARTPQERKLLRNHATLASSISAKLEKAKQKRLQNQSRAEEIEDSPEELEQKLQQLAQYIREDAMESPPKQLTPKNEYMNADDRLPWDGIGGPNRSPKNAIGSPNPPLESAKCPEFGDTKGSILSSIFPSAVKPETLASEVHIAQAMPTSPKPRVQVCPGYKADDKKENFDTSPPGMPQPRRSPCRKPSPSPGKGNHAVKPGRASKGVVVHTGAGLSTTAGIPDFRGPNGVWTLQSKGKRTDHCMSLSYERAAPTPGHMVLAALLQAGMIKHVVSQNVDGLHLRSGVPKAHLSEIHGCVFREQCKDCGKHYLRPFDVTVPQGSAYHRHKTGRTCGEGTEEVTENGLIMPDATARNDNALGRSFPLENSHQNGGGGAEVGPGPEKACESGLVVHATAVQEGGASGAPNGAVHQNSEDSAAGATASMGGCNPGTSGAGEPGTASSQERRSARERGGAAKGCGGMLVDTIVHFNECLDADELRTATEASTGAGLALCLGSSFKVPPASKLPKLAQRIVVVNLQWTPLDKHADLKIHGKLDAVLARLAEILGVAWAPYELPKDPLVGQYMEQHKEHVALRNSTLFLRQAHRMKEAPAEEGEQKPKRKRKSQFGSVHRHRKPSFPKPQLA